MNEDEAQEEQDATLPYVGRVEFDPDDGHPILIIEEEE